MSKCLDCPKELSRPTSLRCFDCNCRRQTAERVAAKRRAAEQKKRSDRLKAALARAGRRERERLAGLQQRLKAETAQRMQGRAA